MVDQGWIGITTSESAGGLGMGSVEAAVLLEQLGRHLAPVPLNQHLNALHVLADTPWSEGLLEGSLIATVARRSVERNADGSVTGRPEPVIYGASADLLVVPAGDELVVVDLTAIDRKPEPAMDRTRELAWIGMEEVPAVTAGDASAVAAHLDRGAVFHSPMLSTPATGMPFPPTVTASSIVLKIGTLYFLARSRLRSALGNWSIYNDTTSKAGPGPPCWL